MSTYAYTDLAKQVVFVNITDINQRGAWSNATAYQASTRDVVDYNSCKYICLIDNTGAIPTAPVPKNQLPKWSVMALVAASSPQIALVGTVPASEAISGVIYYDFAGPAFQETTVDVDVQVSAKNITPGSEISVILVSNGAEHSIAYDPQFSWFGTQVTNTVADKKVLVTLAAAGSLPAKVLGTISAQL